MIKSMKKSAAPIVYLGADHNGFLLKEQVKAALMKSGISVCDCGAKALDHDDDYPAIAARVARQVSKDPESFGLLICGSGNGIAMAANRFSGIRAALAPAPGYARKARQDEDANILVLPAWWVTYAQALRIVRMWLTTPFSGETRHKRRIAALSRYGDG